MDKESAKRRHRGVREACATLDVIGNPGPQQSNAQAEAGIIDGLIKSARWDCYISTCTKV
jgi:hypothetical protein